PDGQALRVRDWSRAIAEGTRSPDRAAWFASDTWDSDPPGPDPFPAYRLGPPRRFARLELRRGELDPVALGGTRVPQGPPTGH
ncbi:MAG: hypothetical protein U0800_26445, partial [Isosphaeraceae bacterium]